MNEISEANFINVTTFRPCVESSREIVHQLASQIVLKYEIEFLKHPLDEYWCTYCQIEENQDDSINKLLATIATMVRINDDLSEMNAGAIIVGKLDIADDGKLSLREACNKIIHASEYKWDLNYSDEHPVYPQINRDLYRIKDGQKFKHPTLSLIGTFKGKKWKADINFFLFLSHCVCGV